jgi:molybdopterin/thiamine biosynthesis adenylyltransferase
MGRYDRNIGTITIEEQQLLKTKSVCVIGCGGLGGGVIENLVRMGVGKLTVVDGDSFDVSNLNRQVLSNEGNIGRSKALEAANQMHQINGEVEINAIEGLLSADNAREIIGGCNVVVDALDNVEARLALEDACDVEGIPLIHGAISGWNGQVGVVMPGSGILHQIYECDMEDGSPTNPSFTPAVVSALQASETIKVLLGREESLRNKLLMIDLLDHEYEVIDFGGAL